MITLDWVYIFAGLTFAAFSTLTVLDRARQYLERAIAAGLHRSRVSRSPRCKCKRIQA